MVRTENIPMKHFQYARCHDQYLVFKDQQRLTRNIPLQNYPL